MSSLEHAVAFELAHDALVDQVFGFHAAELGIDSVEDP